MSLAAGGVGGVVVLLAAGGGVSFAGGGVEDVGMVEASPDVEEEVVDGSDTRMIFPSCSGSTRFPIKVKTHRHSSEYLHYVKCLPPACTCNVARIVHENLPLLFAFPLGFLAALPSTFSFPLGRFLGAPTFFSGAITSVKTARKNPI